MSLRGYVRKTRPAPWTTTPAEVAARKERAALKDARDRAGRMAKRLNWKRIAPVSKSRRSVLAEYRREARLFVAAAVALGETCPVFSGKDVTEVHHVRGRSNALLMDKRFWLAVSSSGHDWIHQHPKQAAERGWLAGPGEWGDSETSSERKAQIDVATASVLGYGQSVNR